MIRLCGLWASKTKDGRTYLSGGATFGTRVVILPNSFKKKEKDPDYMLWLAEKQKYEAQENSEESATEDTTQTEPERVDDDIPF